jgi:DNA-binding NarL/FixJ family response regulator
VKFTPREWDCLTALYKGMTAKETGRHLLISPRTVEGHIENILGKTFSKNKLDLMAKLHEINFSCL